MSRGSSDSSSSVDDPISQFEIENIHDIHQDSDLDSLPPLYDRDDPAYASSDEEDTIYLDKDGNTSTTQASDSDSTTSQTPDKRNPGKLNQEWQRIFYNAFHNILQQQPEPEIYEDTTTPPIIDVPNLPCGDPSNKHKGPNSLQILSNNVNGISSIRDYAELHELCTSLHRHQVDVIC